MRVYGRTWDEYDNPSWNVVETDTGGLNDAVYITALCQALKLNLGESPFYANYGIPAQQTITTQVYPDFYAMQTQTQYAPYFASLTIVRENQSGSPVYTVTAVTHKGAILGASIPI